MEHHANIVPWQMIGEKTGAKIVPMRMDDDGNLDLPDALARIQSGNVRCLSVVHVSNAIGARLPVEALVQEARKQGIFSIVDGSQAVAHFQVDVAAIGCDAYVFSGHKLYGPTGIGALWAKKAILDAMPPYQGGGDMIREVSFEGTRFAEAPAKFEAGTPHIAGAIGLGCAIDFVHGIGFDLIEAIDQALMEEAIRILEGIPGIERVGRPTHQTGALSFAAKGCHPTDLASLLAAENIAVRTGHHCAQPLMQRLGRVGTVRASMAMYNRFEELETLGKSIRRALRTLGIS
jgi:cysteine desulfurase/selenocysteine lyase